MSDAQEVIALHLKAHPWLDAEPESIWRITGQMSDDHTFVDCLAYVLPFYVTGGTVLFQMFPPTDYIVRPDQITRGREFRLVPADSEPHDSGAS